MVWKSLRDSKSVRRVSYALMLAIGAATQLVGCKSADPMVSVDTLRGAPENYAAKRVGKGKYEIPPYAKYLQGVKICIDPGHGGDAHKRAFKRGPTGVREAEMNLRTAKYLREFLKAAGADVKLTREDDVDSSLKKRAEVANQWGADIFFSLHHNAIGNKPKTNYTTVWYHGEVDDRPANLDLARYLYGALEEDLALDSVVSLPLKTDFLMYDTGFGVLRHAKVTAALTESSFYTNPQQEQLLRRPAYNLKEAYALFRGLAQYVAAGLPRATIVVPADGTVPRSGPVAVEVQLEDGHRVRGGWGADRKLILSDTVAIRVNGDLVHYDFDAETRVVRFELTESQRGGSEVVLDIQFQNLMKNSVINPRHTLRVAASGGAMQ